LEHTVLVGKLAVFTALGIPDTDLFETLLRSLIPRNFKGKQSKGGVPKNRSSGRVSTMTSAREVATTTT